ncbi:MAG: alpha/beta fold hydrolase [Lachnospiraceae bacterium]|nr:alpha/beta fold hydrolase [Lachnospiraceae bacterium]
MSKKMRGPVLLVAAILVIAGCSMVPKSGTTEFDGVLYTPKVEQNQPLVIYYHGYGESEHVEDTKVVATLTGHDSQQKHSCYVLAPAISDKTYMAQRKRENTYEAVKEVADQLVKLGKVDPNRIYVMGNSFGGLATVEYLEYYPEEVAGAIAICPALSYNENAIANLAVMKDVPIWFAHAKGDTVVPAEVSREAVSTLVQLGARETHLTEFTDEDMRYAGALPGYHQADFAVMENDEYLDWLFNESLE